MAILKTGTTIGGNTAWHSGNDGAGSGLDADYLDGLHGASFLRSDANTTYNGGLFTVTTPAGSSGGNGNQVNTLQVFQATANTDAFMSFHVGGDYAFHFGLDGTTNDLFVGGWSLGSGVKHRIWHAGNDGASSGLDADLLDGNHASAFALASHTHAYLSAESDTLATVAGRGNTYTGILNTTIRPRTGVSTYRDHGTSSYNDAAIRSMSNTEDCWIYCDEANAQWGIYHRNIDSALAVSGEQTIPGNSLAFIGANSVASYICLADGSAYHKGSTISSAYYNSSGALGSNSANAKNHFTGINSGSAGAATGWIAAAFGDTNGNRTVIGQASGYAYLGAHNPNLSDWAPLHLQNDSSSATVMIGYAWGTAPDNTYRLKVNGAFAATSKSFLIPHPTKEGWKLRYGSLEGPENGVYIRGKLKGKNKIELPEYWTKLVDPDSITVTLTPIGKHQKLYVEDISNNVVTVANDGLFAGEINCFFVVYGERVDIDKLVVEYE